MEPPSESAVKACIFIVQTCHEARQTEQVSGHRKITGNVDASIKSRKIGQRFAVFSASRLHTNNEHQFSRSGCVQQVTWHDSTHLEHSKHEVHSQKKGAKERQITVIAVHLTAKCTTNYRCSAFYPMLARLHVLLAQRNRRRNATIQPGRITTI